MFGRLGAWAYRRRGVVVLLWLGALVVGGAASGIVGSAYSTEFGLPDVESRRGFDVLEAEMGGVGSGLDGVVVLQHEAGFDDPELRATIDGFLDEIDDLPDTTVQSPFADQTAQTSPALLEWYAGGAAQAGEGAAELLGQGSGTRQISSEGPQAGKIAYATIELPGDTDMDAAHDFADEVRGLAPQVDGLRIELGGSIFQEFEPPAAELIGLAFAILILILAFGSVMAMGLPIGVALAGIGIGSILLGLLSNVVEMPDFATTLGIMIGLGVGIDYALFIVTRYREQLRTHSVEEAVAIAIDTSGRAVTFAGITVVISLLGMLLMGVSFVQGLGIGAATMVLITMIASITLLPALLGFVGERIEISRWRGVIAAGLVAVALVGLGLKVQPLLVGVPLAAIVMLAGFAYAPLRRELPRRAPKPLRETFAFRWSRVVQGRPWTLALASAAALLLLAVPVTSIRLGFSDAGNLPEDSSPRQAYDLLTDAFGPGYNGRILVVGEVPDDFDASTSAPFLELAAALAATDGVASVSPPIPSDMEDPSASGAVMWQVFPETSPQDEATTELVRELREEVLPAATADSGLPVLVTGAVGIMVDFSDYLADRLLLFFAAVLSLSFLLLMVVFRSVLVPLKAVVMNLLSIGAAYGVIVAIFQWGWLSDVFGVEPAPIEPFVPMMLFAIVFGLSMDYEVFLLSRIREEWLRTGDSRTSVADGLAATARVISAAAAIMVVVFGSFLLETDRTIKLMGFGLAFAVFLDATVVRMLLVPATMELLGDKNWWIPRWLDRLLPTINVEGEAEHPSDQPEVVAPSEERELEPTH